MTTRKKAAAPHVDAAKVQVDHVDLETTQEVTPPPTTKPHNSRRKKVQHKLRTFAKLAVIHTPLPSILMVTSILFARYLPNSDFSYPSEIVLPIVLFAALAALAFYLYRLLFRGRYFPAHVASTLFIYALYGFNYAFSYIQKASDAVLPSSLTTIFSSAAVRVLLLFIFFGAIAYAIDMLVRHIKPLQQLQVYKIALFAVCFIFAVQAVKVGDRLWTIRHQLAYQYSQPLPAKPASNTPKRTPTIDQTDQTAVAGHPDSAELPTKPNVYYLLFDRYASADTLQRIYGFDNTPMLDFLSGQGFTNRQPVAYSNYPFTQQSTASTLSMGYLPDLESKFKNDAKGFQTAFPYRSIISNPPVAQAFKQNGYQYTQVSSWWDFTRVGVQADNDPTKSFRLRLFGMTFWLSDLQRDIVYRSALSPLLQKGLTIGGTTIIKYDQDRNPRQNFLDQISAIEDMAKNSSKQTQPRFMFAHVLSPHDPYLFAADGSDAQYNGDRTDQDLDEYQKYTNQLTYANTRLQEMISTIRKDDPTAVIVLQADEGPYPKDFRGTLDENHYFDPKNLSDDAARQKFGIMASYYMPGVDSDTVSKEIDSSTNTFRFVLDHYLNYSLPYLPDCNFSAGNKFTLYDFTLMTGRLKSASDPAACKQYDR